MAKIYNLPRLNDTSYPPPSNAGEWVKAGRLDDMANGLDLAVDTATIDELKSVPDPWARPLLFNQALTSPETEQERHIAKDDARAQWRGLLALLALQHFYSNTYLIQIQTIDLNQTDRGNPRFRKVLRKLLPVDTLVPGMSWERTGIITLRTASDDPFEVGTSQGVGLMVPNCLVAPARGMRNVRMADVPWLARGLSDPCAHDGISGDQWAALVEYLLKIIQQLDRQIGTSAEGQRILEELRAFGKDCRRRFEEAGATQVAHKFKETSDELPDPFYSLLTSAPTPFQDDKGPISECLLYVNQPNPAIMTWSERTSPDQANAAGSRTKVKGVILVDPDIAGKAYAKRPEDVKLFRTHKLGTVDQGGNRRAMEAQAQEEGFLVITPDMLFTRKMVSLADEGSADANWPGWKNFLLPLSPLALFLIDQERISLPLTKEDRGDRWEVQLKLELEPASPNAPVKTYTLTRFYDKRTEVIDESFPEDIALWPDIGMDGWPWNFMRFSCIPDIDLSPRFAASRTSLAESVTRIANQGANPSLGTAINTLYALGSPDALSYERMDDYHSGLFGELTNEAGELITHRYRFTETINGAIGEQHILGIGADFLFFGTKPEDDGPIVPAGCIRLPERTAPQGSARMEIAVDFGTTNTVVYMRHNDQTERMSYAPRVNRPVFSKSAEEDQFIIDNMDFFPTGEVRSPFPTVLRTRFFDLRGGAVPGEIAQSNYQGVKDNIFFMPDRKGSFRYAASSQRDGRLVFNLKWSTEASTKGQVLRFLRQIILMSTVEAMSRNVSPANIEWHFSHPQALKGGKATKFKQSVCTAWEDVMQPVLGSDARGKDNIEFETEGAAALRYFTAGPGGKGQTKQLVVMFDIGGGTTELAIYHLNKTKWRSSFRLAGGDFFTRFLVNNPGVFDHLNDRDTNFGQILDEMGGASDPSDNGLDVDDGNVSTAQSLVELYLSQPNFNMLFSRSFPLFSEEPEGVGLVNSAAVALAGLAYYVGLALRELLKSGELFDEDVKEFTMCFAGRGSSLYKFFGESDDEDSLLGQIARMISDVAHAQTDGHEDDSPREWEATHPRVGTRFSKDPKHEVAHGMLCGTKASRGSEKPLKHVPLGEKVTFHDGEPLLFDSDTSITAIQEAVSRNARFRRIESTEFDRFLELLRLRTGLNVKIDSKDGKARERISNATAYAFDAGIQQLEGNEDDESGDTQELEPPFITKLRTLVHILASEVGERQNTVVVVPGEPEW